MILASKDGSALERFIWQHYVARDTALPEDLPNFLRTTAKERIEELQKRIKSKETDAEQKRRYAIEIMAVREAVNAQRGGKGLNKKLSNAEALAERTKELAEKLSMLDGETLGMLRDQALSGHGGEMKKTFESDAIQNKIMKGMEARIDKKARNEAFEDGAKKSFEVWKEAQKAARKRVR